MAIQRNELLMGRDQQFPLSPELETNLSKLLSALNRFRTIYGKPMNVSSGYRPGHFNTDAGGAKNSTHLVCMACDFHDADGSLDQWCLDHLDVLEECGLYLESPDHTHGWCHLQIRPTKNRVFIP